MQPSDYQHLIDGGFAIVMFFSGFILKSIWNALTQLQQDLAALQKNMTEGFVRRDDFQILAARIEATLIRIEAKLDSKADK